MHGVNPTKGPLDPMPSFGAYLTLVSIVLLQNKTILELETSFEQVTSNTNMVAVPGSMDNIYYCFLLEIKRNN